MTAPGVKGNPQEAKGRNMSKEQLNAYLEDDEASSSTDTSIEASHGEDVFPVLRSKITDAIARIGCATLDDDPDSEDRKLIVDGIEFCIKMFCGWDKMKLGVNTHKLLMYACKLFTKNNHVGGACVYPKDPKRDVTIQLRDYAHALGYAVDPADDTAKEQARAKNEMDNARKDMLACARTLIATYARLTGKTGNKSYEGQVNVFESTWSEVEVGRKTVSGEIKMSFTEKMATALLAEGKITQFPYALLSVDPRDPNAYRIGSKMYIHANMDANISRGTEDRLKVETLLKETDLPTIEAVREKGKSWGERIKKPFVQVLDRLVERYGLLSKWRFVGEKGAELSEEDIKSKTAKYSTFAELYVLFDLAHKVDHADRLARRKEETKRLEAKMERKPRKRAKKK